MDNCVSGWN